jgi:hypothetical protein
MNKTYKNRGKRKRKGKGRGVATRGWKNERPSYRQRTIMLKNCGKKCFLGTKKTFPICKKNTCKVSSKGLYAAYIRSRQYRKKGQKYRNVSKKASKMLTLLGFKR